MSWLKLSGKSLKDVLAMAEIGALASMQKPFDVDKILDREAHSIACIWRSRIKKTHVLDKRDDYVPESLLGWIVVHLRYASFTRLPNMGDLLDELRRKEYEEALSVLDNLKKYYIDDVEEGEEEESADGSPVVIVDNQCWKFE